MCYTVRSRMPSSTKVWLVSFLQINLTKIKTEGSQKKPNFYFFYVEADSTQSKEEKPH